MAQMSKGLKPQKSKGPKVQKPKGPKGQKPKKVSKKFFNPNLKFLTHSLGRAGLMGGRPNATATGYALDATAAAALIPLLCLMASKLGREPQSGSHGLG